MNYFGTFKVIILKINKLSMLLFFLSFLTVFTLANYYVARRVWQGTEFLLKPVRTIIVTVFVFSAASYPTARGLLSYFNNWLYDLLLWVGAIHFVNLLYAFLIAVLIDLVRLIFRFRIRTIQLNSEKYIRMKGLITSLGAVIVLGLVTWGNINASDIKIKRGEYIFPSHNGTERNYKIVLFSDSHLSSLNSGAFTDTLIKKISSESPDFILIGGDVIDDGLKVLKRSRLTEKLKAFKSCRGVYLCNGNHEYISGIRDADDFFRMNSFINLSDTLVIIDSSFAIAGRDDSSSVRFRGFNRKSLQEILEPVRGLSLPVLLLDHQPFNLKESVNAGVTLQFSGHTHNGQMLPFNLITSLIYEVSWGYKKIGNTHFYVSSGVGTWGPPVRIGSDSEIIVLTLKIKKQ